MKYERNRRRSVRVTRSRRSSGRRHGGSRGRRGRTAGGVRKGGIIAGAVALALLAGGAVAFSVANRDSARDGGGGAATIVYGQATANAQSVEMSGALGEELRRAAENHTGIRLIGISGDGKVFSDDKLDMTPRLADGTVLKVQRRAEQATATNIDKVARTINKTTEPGTGQAVFLGLERLQLDTSAPIYVVSSLLDTSDPVDMRRLGWDVAPKDVVADLKRSGELPDLSGARITFVVRPVAGAQEQLRQPHVEYREALWTALAKASGADRVRFDYVEGTGSAPGGSAPAVPIPPPPTTPVPVDPASRKCTVDTSAYFASDSDRLLDRSGTKRALRDCVAHIGPNSRVMVVGHTAGADSNSEFAKQLSKRRAQSIADLLVSLGVPRRGIQTLGMGNSRQPYPDPFDARNRSVVVIIKKGAVK